MAICFGPHVSSGSLLSMCGLVMRHNHGCQGKVATYSCVSQKSLSVRGAHIHLQLISPYASMNRVSIGLDRICRLTGAKPLSKPMLGYCQLDPQEQTSMKFSSKYKFFHSRKIIWKYRLRNGGHFCRGDDLKIETSTKWPPFCIHNFEVHFLE